MPLETQLASHSDIEDIFGLMRAMQAEDPWSEPFDESTVRQNLDDLVQNPAFGLLFLARDSTTAVAYLVVCFDFSLEYQGKGAWVDELFVAREHRGKGIATRLLEVAERAAAEHGGKYLHLEVSHGNPAIELYQRRGFIDHQRYLMTKRIAK
ncbi:MAG TPA: GNAT family N-acetyltransferase [Candidatus Saccharimonadales bacterium]|nr:GNAT family N-acetyltransferase [Candidatus Saccharimonadales bacterium]